MADKVFNGITVLVGAAAAIGFLFGLARGTVRSLLRLITILAASFLAALLSRPIVSHCRPIMAAAEELMEGELGTISTALSQSRALTDLLEALPAVGTALVFYIPLFIFFSLLMLIPYSLLIKKKGKKKKADFYGDWLAGALLGTATGVIFLSLLLAPVCWGLAVGRDALDAGETSKSEELYLLVEKAEEHPFVRTTNLYSTELVSLPLRIRVCDYPVNLAEEMDRLLPIMPEMDKLFSGTNDISWGNMPGLVQKASESRLFCIVAADTLKGAADAWGNQQAYLGMELPGEGELTGRLLLASLEVLADNTPETVGNDLLTLAEVMARLEEICSDPLAFLLSAMDEEAESLIQEIFEPLQQNEHMQSLFPVLCQETAGWLQEELTSKWEEIVTDEEFQGDFFENIP